MSASPLMLQSTVIRRGARADEVSQPYPWVMIPPGGVSVFAHGSEPAPAHGTQIVVADFKVPDGWEGVLDHVMCVITGDGGTVVQGSGDFDFSIDIDRPLNAPLATGRFLPNYAVIETQLGDLTRPWPVRGGWRMKQGEEYRFKYISNATVSVGSPCFVHAALLGWVWPMARQGV